METEAKIKIVTRPIIVRDDEAFEQDVLGRKEFGESLLNLVLLSNDELVISLDGKWGEGKTTFVKMWQGLLDKKDIPNIYVNAFESDYSDDAFIAIAGAITAYIAEDENKDEVNTDNFKEFKEKAKVVGVKFLPWMAKVAIKTAALGVIKNSDFEELKNIKDDMVKGLSTVVDDFVSEKLESHKKDVEIIQSFKQLLSEIPTRINSEGDNPLVIIIDELDRCKPTYALDIIEKVKHLFSVKNIVFVLVMNRSQLEKSVKCIYGGDIDAHAYLQKFINIETTIPKKISEQLHDNDIVQYNQVLFKLHKNEKWEDNVIVEFLDVLIMHFELSLRQLERVYTNLAVFYASSVKSEYGTAPMVSFLAVIKVIDPPVYEALLHQRISYEDLCKKTGLLYTHQTTYNVMLQLIVEYLRCSLITDAQFSALAPSEMLNFQALNGYSSSRKNYIHYFAKKLSMFTVA